MNSALGILLRSGKVGCRGSHQTNSGWALWLVRICPECITTNGYFSETVVPSPPKVMFRELFHHARCTSHNRSYGSIHPFGLSSEPGSSVWVSAEPLFVDLLHPVLWKFMFPNLFKLRSKTCRPNQIHPLLAWLDDLRKCCTALYSPWGILKMRDLETHRFQY